MGAGQDPMPMGGASDVPAGPMGPTGGPGDPGAPADMGMAPNDGQNIGAGPGMEDPAMGGGDGVLDPNMGGDPAMDGGMPPMDGEDPMGGGEAGDDSTMSLFNQLSDEDKEAARGYIESMLSRDEGNGGDMGGEEPPMGGEDPMAAPDAQGGAPMMETVIFTKGQLRQLNENMMTMKDDEEDDTVNTKKKGKSLGKKSPFNSPKFK